MSKEEAKKAKTTEKKSVKAKADKAEVAAEKKAEPKAKKAAKPVAAAPKGKVVADVRLYDVIERPVITEKATLISEQNKVVFRIRPGFSKKDVKRAVEALFGVSVLKVNTVHIQGKTKNFRGKPGKRSDVRKAIVTLAAGQSIDLAAGLR